MGPLTQTLTPVPDWHAHLGWVLSGLARAGEELRAWLGWSRSAHLTRSCSPTGSLSSRFSEPSVDQGPGRGTPSALVLINIV